MLLGSVNTILPFSIFALPPEAIKTANSCNIRSIFFFSVASRCRNAKARAGSFFSSWSRALVPWPSLEALGLPLVRGVLCVAEIDILKLD